ncbi:MAG: hypothetical protein ACD_7C00181G0001 [uncultured bacterium]|nr:MAG: hypothetical protein ACD_7C00181G0001 [uncultured bacterium]
MDMKKIITMLFLLITSLSYADEKQEVVIVSRADSIPMESLDGSDDQYFEGYLQALVDMHYHEYKVVVLVKERSVWLANMPKNAMISKSIVTFIKDVPGVKRVSVIDGVPPEEMKKREKYVNRPIIKGVWFPQTTVLFQPMIANPRQVIYSVGYRGDDRVCGKKAIPISLGDDFPVFRWLDVFRWHGDLQLGIEAGIWSVFNLDPHPDYCGGSALVNTDFYVGFPITYAINKWSWRFRGYHISSHLGDEFLVNHPDFDRKNPSYEAIDFFFSYQALDFLRLYGGPGLIIHSDRTFPMKHCYIEYGGEARFLGNKIYYHKMYGTFFAAVYWRNWQLHDFRFDGTYLFGYEWSKLQGIGRKIRMFAEYHHGYSSEGQFMKERSNYWSLRMAWGF